MQNTTEAQRLLKGILKRPGSVIMGSVVASKSRLCYSLCESNSADNEIDLLTKKFNEVTTNLKPDIWVESNEHLDGAHDEREKRKKFERLRKTFYSKYKFVKAARILLAEETNADNHEEDDNDDDDNDDSENDAI